MFRLLAVLLLAAPAEAASLKDAFGGILRFEGQLAQAPAFRRQLESMILSFQRNAVRTADFVATATAPGFAYTWDVESGTPQRTETSPGSIFIEPADTVDRGRLYVSFAYLYSEFTDLDGTSLDDSLNALADIRGSAGDRIDVDTRTFDFRSHVFTVSATYGLSPRWDVKVLTPLSLTQLKLNAPAPLPIPGADRIPNEFSADRSKLGIGDILLRTKYQLHDLAGFQLATSVVLRVPSGNPDDFQGLGDVTLTPTLITQRAIGPHLFQANAGVEVNADNPAQSRARYAVGMTIQVMPKLDLLAHIIGNSGFVDDHFTHGDVSGALPRTDIVDGVAGLEFAFTKNIVAQVGAIVPVTHDGLRAAVTPVGWLGGRF